MVWFIYTELGEWRQSLYISRVGCGVVGALQRGFGMDTHVMSVANGDLEVVLVLEEN